MNENAKGDINKKMMYIKRKTFAKKHVRKEKF